ncbi:MFS transporter [Nocardia fluminea]|uniref:Transmembrane secretion effector n=1 Tax=Nocardia fluminea TaxID=134984 RepID=A0A2N3VJU3_9NOCA|nr:MFS transporter [Nocardia fluminea]PKV81887.1 transmembrane secretion effector [Nocardia fluminea]
MGDQLSTRQISDLRRYTVAQVASTVGSALTSTTVSVTAVAVLGAGPREVSLVVAASAVPPLVLGPFAGVLLDRVSRPRRLLILADLIAASAIAVCAVAAFAGVLTVTTLIGLSLTLGATGVARAGLYFSHLSTLGVRDVSTTRARLQSHSLLARAVGASVAGPLLTVAGAAVMFTCDVLTYLFSALCLAGLSAPDRRETARRGGIAREFADGVRVLRDSTVLAAVALYLLIGGAASGGVAAMRAVFLLDDIRIPVSAYGIPAVAATVSAAVGALAAPRILTAGISADRVLRASVLAAAVCALALPLTTGSLPLALLIVCASTALPTFFGAIMNIALITVMGTDVGDRYFARVGALLGTGTTAANLVGALLGGVLGAHFGVRTGIWVFVLADLLAAVPFAWAIARRSCAASASSRRQTAKA